VRDPLESEFFAKQKEMDQRALQLYKKDPSNAKQFLTDLTRERMERVVKMYTELRELLISKYTNNKQGS
jgi:dipeptidase